MGTTAVAWQALGTGVVVKVTEPTAIEGARSIVDEELQRIDRACSRFRADSDLSRLNAAPGWMVQVDELLVEAVEVALRAAELTDGDVDPAIGEALELVGYDRDWQLLEPAKGSRRLDGNTGAATDGNAGAATDGEAGSAADAPAVTARRRSGWRAIELDREHRSIRLPQGMKLDLGATAKAWAADRAATAAHAETGSGVLVSLGGDIATAGGAPSSGWRIRVTEDHRAVPSASGQTIAIADGGLATSSTTVRRWTHGGAEMHHILDPSTGAPTAGPWRTVSVAAASCTDANIASTAAVIRGLSAPAWLEALGLPGLLIGEDGEALRVAGWPEEDTSRADGRAA